MTRVAYEPDAKAPTWEAFLARIFPLADVESFVQRALGYSATGDTSEQCLFVCYGSGANGKSTLLETVRYVLGDYASHAQTDTLMSITRGRGADNDLVRLRGARFVTAIESGEGRKLDEERVKQLTGGDTVAARMLYCEAFEFKPQFKLWLACNHRPEVHGTDHAIWRRLRLIPFNVRIEESQRDPQLPSKLRAEAAGILAWIMRGLLEWRSGGLRPPSEVTAATEDWRAEANDVAAFVADYCVVGSFAQSMSSALYAGFRLWAASQGMAIPSQKAFSSRLAALGFASIHTKHGTRWSGIGLRMEADSRFPGDG